MDLYYKFYENILEFCKDSIETLIICFILNQNENKIQQTYIASKLYLSISTLNRKLKSIKEKGLLNYRPTYYIFENGDKVSTTEFEMTDKLKSLINNNVSKSVEKEKQLKQNKEKREIKEYKDQFEEAEELQNLLRNFERNN